MRVMALGLAAALAAMTITAPGSAKGGGGSGYGNGHHGGGNHHGHNGQFKGFPTFPNLALPDNLRQTGRRHDHSFGGAYGYGYGYYNEDRTFRSDSYNDWWHDRPDRAYPRWVQAQRNAESCEPDRMWWHGDTLSC